MQRFQVFPFLKTWLGNVFGSRASSSVDVMPGALWRCREVDVHTLPGRQQSADPDLKDQGTLRAG